jgi:hypothetical protein
MLTRIVHTVGPDLRASSRRAIMIARLFALTPLMLVVWLSSARADGIITTSCVRSIGAASCVTIFRRGLGDSYGTALWTPRMEKQAADAAERERLWLARCQPTVKQDAYGVGRYSYAAAGCEFGKND